MSCVCYDAMTNTIKKGTPVHVALACTGSGERSDHFGSYVCSLFLELVNFIVSKFSFRCTLIDVYEATSCCVLR
jgi:hypothetical protein